MSKVLVTESYLGQIANAIRSKLGGSAEYRPGDMGAAILSIPTGGIVPEGTVNITQNGTHDVTQYASANVNVPNSYAAGDEGKVVSNGALVSQTSRNVSANGTYDTTTNDEVVVSVQPNLQSKTATENGTVTPDQGYDGLSSVVVNVSGGGGAAGEAVHVWTKSTGGSDAAIYVQNMLYDAATGNYTPDGAAVAVGYADCQFSSAIYSCNGLVYLSYGNPQYSWSLTAANDSIITNTTYKKGAYVGNWRYDTSVDFYIRRV